MARPKASELTERELEVMHVFWNRGEQTVAAARDELAAGGRDLAYTTVATLVRILVDKGFLQQTNEERPFRFRRHPLVRRGFGEPGDRSGPPRVRRLARAIARAADGAAPTDPQGTGRAGKHPRGETRNEHHWHRSRLVRHPGDAAGRRGRRSCTALRGGAARPPGPWPPLPGSILIVGLTGTRVQPLAALADRGIRPVAAESDHATGIGSAAKPQAWDDRRMNRLRQKHRAACANRRSLPNRSSPSAEFFETCLPKCGGCPRRRE